MDTALASPFHAGELDVQQRAGVPDRIREVGARVIRPAMPDQHRLFYAQLPFLVAAAADADGRPWASLLVGAPGFAQSPDPRRLRLHTALDAADPLAAVLRPGAQLGLLGIELHTRRRNRVNGRLRQAGTEELDLDVLESFGNCPKYIQARHHRFVRDPADTRPRRVERLQALDDEALALIAAADTLFVASLGADGRADASHRGGRPGFVRRDDARTLTVPDFAGNLFFMTLGNLAQRPEAGLLFIDFEHGDLLQLTGRTTLLWDPADTAGFDGAQRAWRFTLDHGWRLRDALPLRWDAPQASPATLATGRWP